jgi:hypothetical protein
MKTSSLKSLVVKLTLVLGFVVGIAPGIAAASGSAPSGAGHASAKGPQQKILAKALTPEVRQALQDAIDSAGQSDRLTAR